MTWNYRVCKRTWDTALGKEETHAVHEVYYDEDGTIRGWSADPVRLTADSPEELRQDLDLMRTAFEKPLVDLDEELTHG